MRWWMLPFAFAAAAAVMAGKAEACNYTAHNEEIGPKRTPREIAADEELRARDRLRRATLEAQGQLADGADAASGLADMLVPNIQPVYIETGSCGVGEIDWAGSDGAGYEPLAGTPYAGRETEFRPIVSDYGPGSLGPDCNAEFRGRFAEHLRRQLTPAQVKLSYVFLAARRPGGAIQRLMAFERRGRRPPVHWVGNAQILDWARRHPTGQALSAAIAAFWSETAPLLASPQSSCPAAFESWSQARADLVARIEAALKPRER